MGMVVNCVAYAEGRRLRDLAVEEISGVLAEAGTFVWLGLHEPDEELMRQVQAQFSLHDLAVEDAHSAHQRPKLETYGDSLFLVLHTAQMPEGKIQFGETHIFVSPRYVVSVRHGPSLSYAAVRARCETSPQLLCKGPGFVLYALMDFVVDNYVPVAQAFEEELDRLEERLFKGNYTGEGAERIYELKQDLMALRRAVAPLAEICTALNRFDVSLIPEDTRLYFRDVYDHALRINEATEIMRDTLATALQVSLSLASVRQNEVTKKLAGWAALLAIPTMVSGIYGMNFQHMPELQWKYGYAAVMGAVALACAVLYRALRRSGWL
jgi:magnesium transporter